MTRSRMQLRCIAISLLLMVVAACSSHPQVPTGAERPVLSFPAAAFGERPPLVAVEDIFRLPDRSRDEFLQYFHAPIRSGVEPHRRVHQYLERITENFDFHSDTFTAAESLAASEGNCLSLAIVTTALADAVGVDVGYQLIEASPVFEVRGDVGVRGLHVRSILYARVSPNEVTWRPGIKIDYFPDGSERFVDNLSREEYFALYYTNIAGESIARGEVSFAYWAARESLRLAPDNDKALNILAVAYGRIGDGETAEKIYRYGIDWLPSKLSFLRNYRALLEKQGRHSEAAAITEQLSRIDEPNPFDWLAAGRGAYNGGRYREAIGLYKRAIEVAPYLHQGYLGIALSHYQLDDLGAAERHLQRAIELAQRRSTRTLYEAKLAALTAEVR